MDAYVHLGLVFSAALAVWLGLGVIWALLGRFEVKWHFSGLCLLAGSGYLVVVLLMNHEIGMGVKVCSLLLGAGLGVLFAWLNALSFNRVDRHDSGSSQAQGGDSVDIGKLYRDLQANGNGAAARKIRSVDIAALHDNLTRGKTKQ